MCAHKSALVLIDPVTPKIYITLDCFSVLGVIILASFLPVASPHCVTLAWKRGGNLAALTSVVNPPLSSPKENVLSSKWEVCISVFSKAGFCISKESYVAKTAQWEILPTVNLVRELKGNGTGTSKEKQSVRAVALKFLAHMGFSWGPDHRAFSLLLLLTFTNSRSVSSGLS